MRRLTLLLVAAATARPENASAYFDAASRLWPPASTAGRCLAAQRQHGDNTTVDCLTRVKPWLARLRAYAAWAGRPADGGFDGVARACARDSSDRSCAAAWRTRAENGAAALGRKHPTVVPRLLATCA